MNGKALTLCADDFAQSPAISDGILALLQAGRLSATCAMSQSPHWPALADSLRQAAVRADIGLHINLTHVFPASRDSVKPLSHWLLMSQLRQLDVAALTDAMLQQIDRFADVYGALPDFLDGHQHVHALPQVRTALFAAIGQRWPKTLRPWLRAPDKLGHAGDSALKGMILKTVCHGFARQATAQGFAVPAWFGGLYSLTAEADFPGLMASWLAACRGHSVMMCHPGLPAEDAADPIGPARAQEYAYLASDRFAEDLARHGVSLSRFLPA